jgi:serine/threonine protein kinase
LCHQLEQQRARREKERARREKEREKERETEREKERARREKERETERARREKERGPRLQPRQQPRQQLTINNKIYILEEILGTGAFGVVYKAYNFRTNEIVAIKKIEKDNFLMEEKTYLEMFKNECDVIVCFKDFQKKTNYVYIVMEYIEGEELKKEHVKKLGIPKLFQILIKILIKICDKDIYHLDIKPANILFNINTNEIKLADFGLTCDRTNKDKKRACGTPGFIAPEITKDYMRPDISCKADVFSMGCTIYKLIFNRGIYHNLEDFRRDPNWYYQTAISTINEYTPLRAREFGLPLDIFKKYTDILKSMLNIRKCQRPDPSRLKLLLNQIY